MPLPITPGTTGPYGGAGGGREKTLVGGRSRQRLEEFAQSPYTTQFEGEAGRIGGLEALAGGRETAALGAQQGALGRAQMAALGQGPSAAQGMMGQGMQQAERTALAGAAEARGPGAALAGRTAQYAGAMGAQQAVGDAATLRAQEQLAAMGQEQAMSTQMRGQALEGGLGYGALGLGTREAGAQEQLAQTQQRLESERLLEESRKGREGVIGKIVGGIGSGVGGFLSGLSDEQAKQAPTVPDPGKRKFDWQQFGRTIAGEKSSEKDEEESPAFTIGQKLSALMPASKGGMTTLSDEEAKQAYQRGLKEGQGLPDGGPAIRRVMEASAPKSFEYKADPGTPRVGLSANKLAETPEGAAAVERGEDGLLRVDPGQASLMAMAGAADLHERLSGIEEYLKKPEGRQAPGPAAVRQEAKQPEDPQAKAASLMAADDPIRRGIGQLRASAALPQREAQPVGDVLAQLGAERPNQRDVMSPEEIAADDMRRFRLRQVQEGAVASRPGPKPARDPIAQQIATTRGVPYNDVLAALGRTG